MTRSRKTALGIAATMTAWCTVLAPTPLPAGAAVGPGNLDTSFNGDGVASFDPLSSTNVAALDVVSASPQGVYALTGGGSQGAVTQFDPSGDLEETFGDAGSGTVAFSLGGGTAAAAGGLVRKADGTLVGAVTRTDGQALVFALQPDGDFETSFDGDGRKVVDLAGGSVHDVAVASDDEIHLFGSSGGAGKVWRVSGAGAEASTLTVNPGGAGASLFVGNVRDDGTTLYVAGRLASGGGRGFVARLSGGSLDSGFSSDGVAEVDFGDGLAEVVRDLTVLGDGTIAAVGHLTSGSPTTAQDAFIAKFGTGGAPESAFGSGGRVRHDLWGRETGDSITVLPGGNGFAVTGLSAWDAGTYMWSSRFGLEGQLRRQYGDNGTTMNGPFGTTGAQADGAVQSDSAAYVVAGVGTSIRVLRLIGGPATLLEPTTGKFVGVTPNRLLDTRTGNGYGGKTTRPAAGSTIRLQVTGRGPVPATGVTAVSLNVTATQTGGRGYVTTFPTGQARPTTSSLNYELAGQTIPANVIVPVGTGGRVDLYTYGATHLIADVTGYWTQVSTEVADGRLRPANPVRLLDTRAGGGAKVAAGGTKDLRITGGSSPIPAGAASAVVLNVTVTQPEASGWVTVFPKGVTRPLSSNLNMERPYQTRPNSVIVKVGAGDTISLYTTSRTHMVVDLAGWFTAASAGPDVVGLFRPLAPSRILDTRIANGRPGTSPVPANGVVDLQVGGRGAVAKTRADAVALNTTVTGTGDSGWITVYPDGTARPLTSNVNYERAGQTIANLVVGKLGHEGGFDLYTVASTHLVGDVTGHFLS